MNQTYNELLLLKAIKRLGEEGGLVPTSVLREYAGIGGSCIYRWLAGLRQKGYITCTSGKGSTHRYTLTYAGMVALVHFGSTRDHVDRALALIRQHEPKLSELIPTGCYEEYGALRVLLANGVIRQVGQCPVRFSAVRAMLEHPKYDIRLEAWLAQY